jgi:hypothetical protein
LHNLELASDGVLQAGDRAPEPPTGGAKRPWGSLTRVTHPRIGSVTKRPMAAKTALDGNLPPIRTNDSFTCRSVFQADFVFFEQTLAFPKNMVY